MAEPTDHTTAASRQGSTLRRGPGRPPTRPWKRDDVIVTALLTGHWKGVALWLAQQRAVPEAKFGALMVWESVPVDLWDEMRAVIGRHLRYPPAPPLTPKQQHRLATLSAHLDARPPEQWTKDDYRKDAERAKLRAKLHGKATIRQIDLSLTRGISAPGVATFACVVTPAYLCRLWRIFDARAAQRHGISARTWRHWGQLQQQSDDPVFASLRHKRLQKAERHRAA
jgi:hypothetical protein